MDGMCFEPLIFGDLLVGQRFISLPVPGDNHGHGGFKSPHRVFSKTKDSVAEAAPGMPYSTPHGVAKMDGQEITNDLPHSMPVILLE
jgi:hypothetical protein